MDIYQAYMNAEQRAYVSPHAIPFDAAANCAPGTREYELFRQIHRARSGGEPWGLVSWKFDHKSPLDLQAFRRHAETAFAGGADCVFINPMIGNEAIYASVWEQGVHCGHSGIGEIACFLDEQTGISLASVSDTSTFAFCNYFIANARFWERYFAFVDAALALLEEASASGSPVGQIYQGSGQYQRDATASMRIFVIERLFSSFLLVQTGLQAVAYQPTAADYRRKFGMHTGDMLRTFSQVKQRAVEAGDRALYDQWDSQRASVLADTQIQTIWNLDDPHPYTLSSGYREFHDMCERLSRDIDSDHHGQPRHAAG